MQKIKYCLLHKAVICIGCRKFSTTLRRRVSRESSCGLSVFIVVTFDMFAELVPFYVFSVPNCSFPPGMIMNLPKVR